MSTRSIVGVFTDDKKTAWKGRYIHYDGYPSGVGLHLYNEYRRAFQGKLDQLIKKLVDDEKIGWGAIVGCDLTLPPTWCDIREPESKAPQSYTARGEKPTNGESNWLYSTDQDSWCEYAYILDAKTVTMTIYERQGNDWRFIYIVNLDLSVVPSILQRD